MDGNRRSQVRERFLALAPAIAAVHGATALTIERVAEVAGLSKQDFMDEFRDLQDFFSAVQLHFFNGRLNYVIENTPKHLTPSLERVRYSLTQYLDYTVQHAAVFAWCNDARIRFPELQAEARKRNGNMAQMLGIEFRSLGWTHAAENVRLIVAVVLELTAEESEAGQPRPAAREALWAFVEALSKHRSVAVTALP